LLLQQVLSEPSSWDFDLLRFGWFRAWNRPRRLLLAIGRRRIERLASHVNRDHLSSPPRCSTLLLSSRSAPRYASAPAGADCRRSACAERLYLAHSDWDPSLDGADDAARTPGALDKAGRGRLLRAVPWACSTPKATRGPQVAGPHVGSVHEEVALASAVRTASPGGGQRQSAPFHVKRRCADSGCRAGTNTMPPTSCSGSVEFGPARWLLHADRAGVDDEAGAAAVSRETCRRATLLRSPEPGARSPEPGARPPAARPPAARPPAARPPAARSQTAAGSPEPGAAVSRETSTGWLGLELTSYGDGSCTRTRPHRPSSGCRELSPRRTSGRRPNRDAPLRRLRTAPPWPSPTGSARRDDSSPPAVTVDRLCRDGSPARQHRAQQTAAFATSKTSDTAVPWPESRLPCRRWRAADDGRAVGPNCRGPRSPCRRVHAKAASAPARVSGIGSIHRL
jgi:hypothetical protein